MAPHKRTRTGCWTCREAGYKCDELKPFCGRCTRLNIACKGYGTKLKWKNTTFDPVPGPNRQSRNGRSKSVDTAMALSPISVSSSYSAPSVTHGTGSRSPKEWIYNSALSPSFVPDIAPDLSADEKRLLHYWTENLSFLISVTPRCAQPSPFHLHLTSMAYIPGALRSTVLSMAANHLALVSNDRSLKFQGYRHQQNAIESLQRIIQAPTDSAMESALAAVLMMQVSARLFGEEDAEPRVANHLIGAKAMVTKQGGLAAWSSSSTARFLLSLFAYHDILASVSRSSEPLLEHFDDFNAIEDTPATQSIAKVLHLVARISRMQVFSKSWNSSVEIDEPLDAFHALGVGIERDLRNLDISSPASDGLYSADFTDITLTAEAYRHAAFIYLYRVWHGFGAPNPTTLFHVKQCLFYIQQINVSSPLVSSHIWPLWTAGCEAIDINQREFVRDRFRGMYLSKMFPSLQRLARDIEDVWTCKDSENIVGGNDRMEKVDCIQVIMKRRGREVDLA